ncbi:MAG: 30S ribosomal protein S21 [Crocinitomicaceae bacterium]|jgi:small subunit ribosomal protein S21|nr:30S ribosomal protein S21 [Crocinitomicaceae bacterium]MBT5403539.1 30S ribosomal protein S21 [Crocinitomicaceae bacterium]MBT6514968.1 30S ribosomal protein S21 [Crocinitomicaceae bacterium]MDG2330313.1 30S ribosomal protein S21 [Flavobacteriales bacterium]
MLIIPVKEGDSIERALKKYKKKFEKVGTVKELRARQYFEKPSVTRREEVLKAAYKQRMQEEEA